MPLAIEVLKHDFRYRNGLLIANSAIIDVEINLQANENTSISMIVNSDLDIQIGDELRFKAWYDSAPATILDAGSFYVDSYTRVRENYKIDGIIIPFASVSKGEVNYVTQTLNQVVADVAASVGFTANTSPNGTFIVGTSDITANPRTFSSPTSKIDAFYRLGKDYGYWSYIWNFQLYSVDFTRYWSDPTAPIITYDYLLENEWQANSIDVPKTIDTIKWALPSPGIFTPANISLVAWGSTVDLQGEGFYNNNTSANARLRGYIVEATYGVSTRSIKIPARIGTAYLPGRKIFVADLNGFASPWIIRRHTWNYGSGGFTSTFDLQFPSNS